MNPENNTPKGGRRKGSKTTPLQNLPIYDQCGKVAKLLERCGDRSRQEKILRLILNEFSDETAA